jgi:NAD(P)-dependent dehydrogenase (short-subunit alcohol dehydrogenase family)
LRAAGQRAFELLVFDLIALVQGRIVASEPRHGDRFIGFDLPCQRGNHSHDIGMAGWTAADIPPQVGKTAVITGATGGLGYETALALAGAGATVVLTGRNDAKGRHAMDRIRARFPAAKLAYETLDLASLASIADFAARFAAGYPTLDILINNAGVMGLPKRKTTADGFEMQFGTNYIGHYALIARLLPRLRRGEQPRVVNLSSLAHRSGRIHFDDLQGARSYGPWRAYCQSKLAMLMFALELQRRSDTAGWGLTSIAAHPGYARTDIIANGPGTDRWTYRVNKLMQPYISQSAAEGALPVLFAATSPDAKGGGYYGPNWFYELKGAPVPAKMMPHAKDAAAAARLWDVTATITGVSFDQFAAAA